MNDLDRPLEEAAITHIDAVLKRLISRWASTKKARIDLDFKTVAQALDGANEDIRQLANSWDEHQTVIKNAIQVDQDFILSDAYPAEVEKAMKDAEIPIRGEFPNYELSPFKLTFSRNSGYVKLSMGRRSKQTKIFAPLVLADWVSKEFQRVTNSKFDTEQFSYELLVTYELLNPAFLTKSGKMRQ